MPPAFDTVFVIATLFNLVLAPYVLRYGTLVTTKPLENVNDIVDEFASGTYTLLVIRIASHAMLLLINLLVSLMNPLNCVLLPAPGVRLVLTASSIATQRVPLYLNKRFGAKSKRKKYCPSVGLAGKPTPALTVAPFGGKPSPVKYHSTLAVGVTNILALPPSSTGKV